MIVVSVLIKWAHLASAGVVVGAAVLIAWARLGRYCDTEQSQVVLRATKSLIHSCLGLLLLTGGYNLWQALQTPTLAHSSYYEALLAAKIALSVICFALAIILFRDHAGITIKPAIARGFAVTGLLILLLSGMMNLAHIGLMASRQ